MPIDLSVQVLLHCDPNKTMMSSAKFILNGLWVDLDLVVNFADDIIFNDSIKFSDLIER